jgi:hypothetical protein
LPPAGATVPPWLPAISARVSNLPVCCALDPRACACAVFIHLLGPLVEIVGAGRRSRRGDFETTACPLRQLQETAGGASVSTVRLVCGLPRIARCDGRHKFPFECPIIFWTSRQQRPALRCGAENRCSMAVTTTRAQQYRQLARDFHFMARSLPHGQRDTQSRQQCRRLGSFSGSRRASAHVSDAPLGCFLGCRFWLCRKLKHGCLLTLA